MPTNGDRGVAAGDDWAVHTADTITSVVDAVRNKTTVPLTTVARGLVYGIIAGVMGTMALVLLAVALVRALDVYLPGDVWSAHAVTGGIFTLGGLFLWRKRRPPTSSER